MREELGPPEEPRWGRDITLAEALADEKSTCLRPHMVLHTGHPTAAYNKHPPTSAVRRREAIGAWQCSCH
jgi:hypothetical protein